MIVNNFIESPDYQEFKEFMFTEFKDKPLDIDTKDKEAKMIALEVLAAQSAILKIEKAFRKFEGLAVPSPTKRQPMR